MPFTPKNLKKRLKRKTSTFKKKSKQNKKKKTKTKRKRHLNLRKKSLKSRGAKKHIKKKKGGRPKHKKNKRKPLEGIYPNKEPTSVNTAVNTSTPNNISRPSKVVAATNAPTIIPLVINSPRSIKPIVNKSIARTPIKPPAQLTTTPTVRPPIKPPAQLTTTPTVRPTIKPPAQLTTTPTVRPTIKPTVEPIKKAANITTNTSVDEINNAFTSMGDSLKTINKVLIKNIENNKQHSNNNGGMGAANAMAKLHTIIN